MSAIDDFDLELAYTMLEMYAADRIDADLIDEHARTLVKNKGHLYLFIIFVAMNTADSLRGTMPAKVRRKIKSNRRKGLPGGIVLSLESADGEPEDSDDPHFLVLQSASQIVCAFTNEDDQMGADLARAVMTRGSETASRVANQILTMFRMVIRGGEDQNCPFYGEGHDHD